MVTIASVIYFVMFLSLDTRLAGLPGHGALSLIFVSVTVSCRFGNGVGRERRGGHAITCMFSVVSRFFPDGPLSLSRHFMAS